MFSESEKFSISRRSSSSEKSFSTNKPALSLPRAFNDVKLKRLSESATRIFDPEIVEAFQIMRLLPPEEPKENEPLRFPTKKVYAGTNKVVLTRLLDSLLSSMSP